MQMNTRIFILLCYAGITMKTEKDSNLLLPNKFNFFLNTVIKSDVK